MEDKIAIILGKQVFMNFKPHVKFHKPIFTLEKKKKPSKKRRSLTLIYKHKYILKFLYKILC